ncbi:two-component regulator propeller domain-containing protein [Paraflavitalea pollutisoli]|uniref:sensor histidine kinase n=1 Tax=Paraflavitalea pollutisoli TaxID=3034143 RepID=UPI0023EC7861|nr:two-component regulator propeller domain-containing protein [Paraflavitalea sp. H1-2-19X]
MRNWLTIWAFLFLPVWVLARQSPFSFRTITINQGLSQNSVIDIANDDKGFLWFATQDGLNRYDGKEMTIFRKTFDDITTRAYSRLGKIIPGQHHDLWLITSGGKLERFNLYNDSFTRYRTLPMIGPLPPLSCFRQEKEGPWWIGTQKNGLYFFDSTIRKVIHYTSTTGTLTSDSVQHLYQCRNQQYWVLTSNGITVIDPAKAINSRLLYNAAGTPISCSVMAEDNNNQRWVGTYARGLYCSQPGDTALRPFTGFNANNTIPNDLVVQAIRTDQQGRVWIGTLGDGLYIINNHDKTIRHLLPEDNNAASLSYIDVLCLQPDQMGGMWIGTDGGGVSFYDKRLNLFSLLSRNTVPKHIPIEQVRSVTTDALGGLWIGTSSSGLSYSPDHSSRTLRRIDLLTKRVPGNKERIVSLYADEEDVWVGTQDNGLLILDNRQQKPKASFTPQQQGTRYLADHTVWCILPSGSQRAWLGTRNAGLCLLDKQQGLISNYRHQPGTTGGIADNNIRAITKINDSLLCLAFESKGIQFFHIRTGTFSDLSYTKALQQIRVEEPVLKSLCFRPPYLWMGTLGNGILLLDSTTGRLSGISEKQGLPNNTIYSIIPDDAGNLWMSTNGGIIRCTPPANLAQINRSHFSLFTVEDGLQGNEFNTGAFHASSGGVLYFGGTNGLNWFDPHKYTGADPAAPVVITQASINNEPWTGDTAIPYKNILNLAWHQNSLSFSFAALDYVAPRKFNYYFQLYPYDKNWISAGNRNYAAYTNIPPGHYTFRVKAWGQPTGSNDQEALLIINIRPPFWKTGWFIGLLVLALISILYGLYRYRINRLIELQQVRNRIATDLHDDIGSTLTNISILSELSRQQLHRGEAAAPFLDRIAEEVNNSSQALDDIVWSINTNNDTLDQTVARMRRYAAEIFDGSNIGYSLHLDEQFAHRKLNMEQRRDCFLLFKEVINNIYKHAEARNVVIKVWLDGNQLHMTIEDDGKGFDTRQTTHRNGLKNMQQRVNKWKGQLLIASATSKGTRTSITLPVSS